MSLENLPAICGFHRTCFTKLYEAFVSFVFHGICSHLGIMVASCRTRRTMSPLAAGFRGWPWRMLIAYAVDSTILEETHRAAALCGGGC